MARSRRTRPEKLEPDPPDSPPAYDPAPPVVESGAVWDGVEAGADVDTPERVADLDLRDSRWFGAHLRDRRFTGLRARDVRFERCDLSGASLEGAVLQRVAFVDCRLSGTVLSGAELADVRVSGSRADLASFRMATASFLLVEDSSLHGADFYELTGTSCAFLRCDLGEASFRDARLEGTRLHGSVVEGIEGVLALRGARISEDQLAPLGAAVLDAMEIRVSD